MKNLYSIRTNCTFKLNFYFKILSSEIKIKLEILKLVMLSKLSNRKKRIKRSLKKAKSQDKFCVICYEPCLWITWKCKQPLCKACRLNCLKHSVNICPYCKSEKLILE